MTATVPAALGRNELPPHLDENLLTPRFYTTEFDKAAKTDLEIAKSPIHSERLATLIRRIKDNTISGKIAKVVFESMINDFSSVDEIIEKKGLKQVTDLSEIETLVDKVIASNPDQVQQLRDGKEQVLGLFSTIANVLNPKELSKGVNLYNCLFIVSGSTFLLKSIETLIPS